MVAAGFGCWRHIKPAVLAAEGWVFMLKTFLVHGSLVYPFFDSGAPMIFSKEDLKVEKMSDLIEFLPICFFIGLVGPFVFASYKLGFLMDVAGWLNPRK